MSGTRLGSALGKLAERVRALENRRVPAASSIAPAAAAYVLGASAYTAALTGEIPVPRYAYHPDMLPAAPGALDDEHGAAPAGYTWLNQLGATATAQNSCLVLYRPGNGSQEMTGYYKAAPATPWTLTARVALGGPGGSNGAGLMLRESATAKLHLFTVSYSGGYGGDWVAAVSNWSDYNAFVSWGVPTQIIGQQHLYLRVRDDGANLYYWWSVDGAYWYLETSYGRGAYMTTGPDQVGYAMYTTTIDVALVSDFIRKT